MRVPLMRYSGWQGANLFRASLKNQQRLFRNLMPCIPPTHSFAGYNPMDAESVSKFAAPAQACDIYDNLGKFLDQPPENFVVISTAKGALDGANCSSCLGGVC